MHIVQIISSYGPAFVGNEIHGELGRAIIARGHRYSILTLARHDAPPGLNIWDDGGITVYELGQSRSMLSRAEKVLSMRVFHYPLFLFALRSFGQVLRTQLHDADLLLVEGAYPLGAVATLWQPIVQRPLAVVLQGGDLHREDTVNYGFGRYAVARWLATLTVQRATLLRTYSPLMYDAAVQRGADPSRIHVVAQNIGEVCYIPAEQEPQQFRKAARQAVVERLQLHGRHILVAVGRLLPIKGFDGLIQSLPAIEQMVGERVELILCGPARPVPGQGDYRAHLEQLAHQFGVYNRLHLTGELPHAAVREYLAAADLLVIPSVMEGGAKVLMEGAAVGTPFVATETAGTPAHLPQGGFTVPPLKRSPTGLARAVAVLLRNDDLRLHLGQQALQRAPWFNADNRAEELLPLYAATVQKE